MFRFIWKCPFYPPGLCRRQAMQLTYSCNPEKCQRSLIYTAWVSLQLFGVQTIWSSGTILPLKHPSLYSRCCVLLLLPFTPLETVSPAVVSSWDHCCAQASARPPHHSPTSRKRPLSAALTLALESSRMDLSAGTWVLKELTSLMSSLFFFLKYSYPLEMPTKPVADFDLKMTHFYW